MSSPIALFDVDHTLISGSTGRRFALAAAARGILDLRYLASFPWNFLAYRLGILGRGLRREEYPAIRGIERSVLEELGREVFRDRTKGALRDALLERVARIKGEGGAIVLATSSLDFIVRPLAEHVGADALLATELEYESGRTTGRLVGRALFGKAKLDAAAAYVGSRGARLGDCSFYSDSIHDLPLLLEAGKPVAVAPDARLKRVARSRGWEIIEA
jgi:HAD superfamily hydrolase (TIGR01490 family)